jgi:hypothetical protein
LRRFAPYSQSAYDTSTGRICPPAAFLAEVSPFKLLRGGALLAAAIVARALSDRIESSNRKEIAQIKDLEHVLIEKVDKFFRNRL